MGPKANQLVSIKILKLLCNIRGISQFKKTTQNYHKHLYINTLIKFKKPKSALSTPEKNKHKYFINIL